MEGGQTMARVTRWDPLRDMITLRQAVDRMLDETFARGTESRLSLIHI